MKRRLVLWGCILSGCMVCMVLVYEWMNSRTFQLFGTITSHVQTTQRVVALTFDDGPTANVDTLLPILDKNGVKATFFLIGNELEKQPGLGKAIAQAGHQIGNHTYSHQRMVFKSPSYIKNEIESTNRLIRETGYMGTIDFRPPNGKKLIALPYYLMRQQIRTVTWNLEPDTDYTSVADKVNDVMEHVEPGSIILMHPMYDKTGGELAAVEQIIQGLKAKGYTFVTVQQLLTLGG